MSRERGKGPPSAVALRYTGSGAPRVSAKGQGTIAEKILALAEENDIPLYKDAELAGLLSQVDLGAEIPEALYIAVAEVIAFAYRLAAEQSDIHAPAATTAAPAPPPDKA